MKFEGYTIFSCWGPRRESPQSIARRFLRLIDRLASINPVFGNWIYPLDPEPIELDLIRNEMAEVVARHVSRADDGDPTPIDGYTTCVVNTDHRQPRCLDIYVQAGAYVSTAYRYINHASIGTCRGVTPDPAILTFQIIQPALLALAETFDAIWCCAHPNDVKFSMKSNPLSRLGWMNYVSSRFAPLIKPPQSAIVEYRPNGGLLMSATNETFVTENPQHLAVAREIEASLAPLNALPWPPDAEPESGSANE
jgi:hypothetical protein